ncbi:MAG TPA: hypothetical protein VMM54_11220 [Nitrospirota bacterium]|nr:hypothetical protein [Nitrospirota bacterium]
MQRRHIVFWVLFQILILSGCTKTDPVNVVKNGVLEMDRSVNIGSALDHYAFFKSTSWKTVRDSHIGNIVIFEGALDIDKYSGAKIEELGFTVAPEMVQRGKARLDDISFTFIAQFTVNTDGSTFQLTNSSHRMEGTNRDTKQKFSQDMPDPSNQIFRLYIYKNKPDPILLPFLLQ